MLVVENGSRINVWCLPKACIIPLASSKKIGHYSDILRFLHLSLDVSPQLHSMLLAKSGLEWELWRHMSRCILELLSLIAFPIPQGLGSHRVVGSSFILHS